MLPVQAKQLWGSVEGIDPCDCFPWLHLSGDSRWGGDTCVWSCFAEIIGEEKRHKVLREELLSQCPV